MQTLKNMLEVIFLTTAKEQFALGSKYTDIGRELGDNN